MADPALNPKDTVDETELNKHNGPKLKAPSNEEAMMGLIETLQKEIAELKKTQSTQLKNLPAETKLDTILGMQNLAAIGPNGIQGIQYKYPIEADFYPDPTDRLYNEPLLKRFSMRENYYFDWEVTGVMYEKHNITYAEPRFTVRLFRRLFNDDGTPQGKLVLVNRQMMHEDEFAARRAFQKLGIPQESFDDMMNEYRYQVIKKWLMDIFTPPKINQHGRISTTMVIDGKAVEVFDEERVITQEAGINKASSIKRETAI